MSIVRRIAAGGVAIGVTLLAGGAQAAAAADAPPAAQRLVSFSSCEELLGYERDHLPEPVPYDPSKPIPPTAMPTPAAGMPETDSATAAPGGSAVGEEPDFSSTNVQEDGVDEPDTVKTDGRRIFTIARGKFVELDARSATPRVLGTLRLEGNSQQLLLSGHRALVIAQVYSAPIGIPTPLPVPQTAAPAPAPSATNAPSVATPPSARPAMVAMPTPSQTLLTELDLTLPGRPRIVRNLRVDGALRAARVVDGIVRLVTSASPQALVDEDVRAQVAGWVPHYRVRNRRTGRTATRPVSACTQVRRPAEFSGFGLLTVLSIDLARGLTPVDSDSVLADVGTVYSSRDALYVASYAQQGTTTDAASPDSSVSSDGSGSGSTASTLIHKFALRPDGQTQYRASGRVAGSLLSQWSLSEQDGVVRAASTVTPPWTAGVSTQQSESFVTTLGERDGKLVQLGQVGGLGRGERIYAVRFIGDVGYVVTFRQTDPLYTLDLADPARPRLLGELKIPGYSAYLHPVGEDLLLGVGQDADELGRRRGGQVSLFDVSDLRRPRRLATAALPGWSSQVEWDHHAFLYWPRTRLAVIPADGFGADGTRAGASGFRITRAGGLRKVGELRHPDAGAYSGDAVDRSVVVGRRLFTLSDLGVMSSDLDSLADGRWLAFPDAG
ncbi:beta-propeller domain-containing protein [Conexibacter sp. CPCC 206217]|uniref:beta-propeller domain-containing protein n=1 Tax=Conexibacter sp. CPCC 206217 TaxID=3064574 RepID=UPI00271A52C1|nr:beta-propeller domain-containing protein [Conexibacter sp. CPCC 206217]MDO8210668.1 beta-propeller domain-containing protein [Conexibacter sp. CPCC 206217]